LFLPHIIGELCALAAGLDAAAIIRRLCRLLGARGVRSAGDSLALAVLESAGIPADAGLQVAQAGRPQAAHLVAARRERVRELLGGRLQAGDRGACRIRSATNGKRNKNVNKKLKKWKIPPELNDSPAKVFSCLINFTKISLVYPF